MTETDKSNSGCGRRRTRCRLDAGGARVLLILTDRSDVHVDYVRPFLEARGVAYHRIDPGDFPADATLTFAYDHSSLTRSTGVFGGEAIDFAEVRTVWLRYPSRARVAPDVTEPDFRRAVADIATATIAGLADILSARWSPANPRDTVAAQNKIRQLAVAPQVGFVVPRTRITNDPAEALRFYEECAGQMVVKLSAAVHAIHAPEGKRVMATHPVRRRDLVNLRSLSLAPMILQEYVPKRVELRVVVVGQQVFAAEIDSQASARSRHDWRHYDLDATAYRPHALPEDVSAACRRLLGYYGLRYGGIDLVLRPDGQYVFLELNPTGQWAFVQDLTGLPIAAALAEDLDPSTPDRLSATDASGLGSTGRPFRSLHEGSLV